MRKKKTEIAKQTEERQTALLDAMHIIQVRLVGESEGSAHGSYLIHAYWHLHDALMKVPVVEE